MLPQRFSPATENTRGPFDRCIETSDIRALPGERERSPQAGEATAAVTERLNEEEIKNERDDGNERRALLSRGRRLRRNLAWLERQQRQVETGHSNPSGR